MSDEFNSEFNLDDGDGFYQSLIEAHQSLKLEDSHRLNARLVLMMANEIGQLKRLQAILVAARESLSRREI